MQENRQSLLVPALIGAAVVGGVLLWAGSGKASSASTGTSTPEPLPLATKCVVSQDRLAAWSVKQKQISAFHVPMLGIDDPVSANLAIDILPSEIRNKINALPNNEHLVLVDKNDVFHYFENHSAKSTRRDDLYADYCAKDGLGVAGHPADLFMVI